MEPIDSGRVKATLEQIERGIAGYRLLQASIEHLTDPKALRRETNGRYSKIPGIKVTLPIERRMKGNRIYPQVFKHFFEKIRGGAITMEQLLVAATLRQLPEQKREIGSIKKLYQLVWG